jgi:hypothetical protein
MPKCNARIYVQRMLVIWITLACMNIQLSGCLLLLGAGAGAGGAVYIMGKIEDEIDASVSKLQRATVRGLGSLNMPVVKEHKDQLSAEVASKTADESTVRIHITSITPSRSKISIRVGLMGDERRSRQILGAISSYL